MSTLCKNLLLAWPDPPEGSAPKHVERVLWADPPTDTVVLIRLFDERALPGVRSCAEVERAVGEGVARPLGEDPYAAGLRGEEVATPKIKARRERAWEAIGEVVVAEPDIYLALPRGRLLAEVRARILSAGGKPPSKTTHYGYLRLYWQAGFRRDALFLGLHRNGGRGKARLKPGIKKRGRPPKHGDDAQVGPGVNVDVAHLANIERSIKLFFENGKEPSFAWAHQRMGERFYVERMKLVAGVSTPVLLPPDHWPSVAQLKYRYYKQRRADPAATDTGRRGKRAHLLSGRALLDKSTRHAFGPGHTFQIDATIADLTLVSSMDRHRIIGRPTFYLVLDVFSHMIVGFHVTLEHASYRAATLALENAASDKAALCRRYRVELGAGEWHSRHLCSTLLADRGELAGQFAGIMVRELAVSVENTGSYRADLKGMLERRFRTINDVAVRWIAGCVDPAGRRRGERDKRLDAIMTLEEFRRTVILFILEHNCSALDDYPRDEFQVPSEVETIPFALWEHGLRRNRPRVIDPVTLRSCLLPRAPAIVTAEGLRYKGMRYTCPRAVKEQWFTSARLHGTWEQTVAFDPRWTDEVYLVPGGRSGPAGGLEVCALLPGQERFQGRDLLEVDAEEDAKSLHEARRRGADRQTKADFNAQRDAQAAESRRLTEEARAGRSRRSRGRDIRPERERERDAEREAARGRPAAATSPDGAALPANVIPISPGAPPAPPAPAPEKTTYVPPATYDDLLDQAWDANS